MARKDPWWNWLFNMLHGHLAGEAARPDKVDIGFGMAKAIESTGYSVEEERMHRVERYREFCHMLVADPEMQAETTDAGLKTKCNYALRKACIELLDYQGFDGMMANAIIRAAKYSPGMWRMSTGEHARKAVIEGGFAFAGKEYPEHGHVALIYPGPMMRSGSWDVDVPLVANVGRRNGVMKVSQAFPVSQGQPDYFVYTSRLP